MRNKGAIKLLAIALALVSLYQLSFTWASWRVDKKARTEAQGDSSRYNYYKDSVSSEPVYNFLGIKNFTYRECQEREFNLGLDLKGGMNVILEVSVVDVINVLANDMNDTLYVQSIERAKELQKDSQEDFVTLFGRAFEEIEPNGLLASIFSSMELRDRIQYNSTNEDVLRVIRQETDDAIENSKRILRERVDRFGVSQTSFQDLSGGRVLIALPGINEPERVRNLLQGAAKLEFWETYKNEEIYPFLQEANIFLQERQKLLAASQDTTTTTTTTTTTAGEDTQENPLLADLEQEADSSQQESLIDQLGSDSTQIQGQAQNELEWKLENPLFAVLPPMVGMQNNQYFTIKGAGVGRAHVRDRTKVDSILNDPQVRDLFPRDVKFVWSVYPEDDNEDYFQLIALKVTSRDGAAALDGDVVTRAVQSYDNLGQPEVSMQMNSEGTRIWARLTRESIGKQIAIVLDGFVYSHPNVGYEITGGSSSISGGGMEVNDAQDLANVLKSGKMRAPATIIQEAVVGPSLGKQARNAGLLSFLVAFVIVLVYMVFYYNRAGIIADIALIINIFFILGVLASLGATLTLPGIAGIVLTIGMSVDANVLIYERIREEKTAGKGIKLALKDGYKNAYSAIIDANVTTVLVGFILYTFGTGPIQGFATTLIIGIFTSLFAAIFITRLIFTWALDNEKKIAFSTKLTEGAFKNLNINFIKKRKTYYVISGVLIFIAIISLATRGLNQGIDFSGGRSYVVRFDSDINSVDVAEALTINFESRPSVKTYGSGNDLEITTKYLFDNTEASGDSTVLRKLYEGLSPFFQDGITYDRFTSEEVMRGSEKVGPTISDDIMRAAIISITFALIAIFVYILIRFKNWQYGLGAIAALAHDVLILLGIYSLCFSFMPFSLEIDQAFIAAILTVIGYSINDTVVVFDRIREYTTLYRKRERVTILNTALNSTLSRTFSTSLSTFFVLLAIFLFGGASIKGFIFAMMIGVLVGTYSSLFIASPIVYDLRGKFIDKLSKTKDKK